MNWFELLPLLLKLVGYFLDRSNASNETKEKFYHFLESIIADEGASAKLRASAMSQRERILQKIKEGKE